MRVSVLLPFRNAATTLDAAIASIAAQTLGEWELILIDNASNDSSRSGASPVSSDTPRRRASGARSVDTWRSRSRMGVVERVGRSSSSTLPRATAFWT